MPATKLVFFLLAATAAVRAAETQWSLDQSTLVYHVSHPLHQVDGISHAARGKGICEAGECNFLIAVPVKSFDSGDSNRDLHMLQVTRGAEYPLISVRTTMAESALHAGTIHVDLEIQFAGQTMHYKQLPFELTASGNTIRLSGTIPATLADFKIDAPTLLSIPIKGQIPIRVEMTWKRP